MADIHCAGGVVADIHSAGGVVADIHSAGGNDKTGVMFELESECLKMVAPRHRNGVGSVIMAGGLTV